MGNIQFALLRSFQYDFAVCIHYTADKLTVCSKQTDKYIHHMPHLLRPSLHTSSSTDILQSKIQSKKSKLSVSSKLCH